MADYSFIERLLHRISLQITPFAELIFDLDQKIVNSNPEDISRERHVFVSGLARAGTTILMRRLYDSREFSSLTYRDMPFVLSPNIWKKLTGKSKKNIQKTERAHGDRILVDIDSPESLEEVFWRIFDGDAYIKKSFLLPHVPEKALIKKYVSYINAILYSRDNQAKRYLSKNNNNILRLKTIQSAFPNSLILIPFREPLSHATSLLKQHQNFSGSQKTDAFVKDYMRWLVHHEFGQDHRPFQFTADFKSKYNRDSIEYWLELWIETYQWLEGNTPDNSIFVCYEKLCSDPSVWENIADLAELNDEGNDYEPLHLSQTNSVNTENIALLETANNIYQRLLSKSSS